MDAKRLLPRLMSDGREVSVVRGRLAIKPRQGRQVSEDWMKENAPQIFREIAELSGSLIFLYEDYSTGSFGENGFDGINLMLINALDGSSLYALFNASLKREKTTASGEAGASVRPGEFRLKKGCNFLKLWKSLGLRLPQRPLSGLHDYMGNLKGILLVGEMHAEEPERVKSSSIKPLELPAIEIRKLLSTHSLSDKRRTTPGHIPDNSRTNLPDNPAKKSNVYQLDRVVSSAGENNYGNKVIRQKEEGRHLSVNEGVQDVSGQSTEEWLAEYSGNEDCP